MSAAVSNKKDKHSEGAKGDMEFMTGRNSQTNRRSKQVASNDELMNLMYQALVQIQYGKSKQSNKGKNQQIQDMNKILEFVEATQKLPNHTQIAIKEEIERFVAKNPRPHDVHPDRSLVVVNPKIITFMDRLVRKSGRNGRKKIGSREGDYIADADMTIQTQKNGPSVNGLPIFVRKRNSKGVEGASRKALANVKGESKRTHSYANAKPDVFQNVQDQATHDILMKSTAVNMKRAELMQARDMTAIRTDTNADNDFGENRGLTRHGRALGSKYMMAHHQTDHGESDMNDF
jgi:hypothetical protein